MKIAMSGASGFVGTALRNALEKEGHEILPLSRKELGMESKELAARLIHELGPRRAERFTPVNSLFDMLQYILCRSVRPL